MGRCHEICQNDLKIMAIKQRYSINYLVYPTYHEWTENVLQLGDLKKFKFDSLTNSNVRVTKT